RSASLYKYPPSRQNSDLLPPLLPERELNRSDGNMAGTLLLLLLLLPPLLPASMLILSDDDMARMMVKNMPLKLGHTLTVTGIPLAGTNHFVLEILSGAYKALHMNVRFDHKGVLRQVVCSAQLADGWGAEVRQGGFPFKYDELFKFTVTLTLEEFLVVLSDGSEIHFPNRLGASEYKNFSFWGGVLICSFEIN
ncbi:unnamed protein product, partial [Arctogadus glacialis]